MNNGNEFITNLATVLKHIADNPNEFLNVLKDAYTSWTNLDEENESEDKCADNQIKESKSPLTRKFYTSKKVNNSLVEEYTTFESNGKMIYTKISGNFKTAEDVINDVFPILDDYLFDFRCYEKNNKYANINCQVDYFGDIKVKDYTNPAVTGYKMSLNYNKENDRFEGTATIQTNIHEDVVLNAYYDEINHSLHTLDEQSEETLKSVTKLAEKWCLNNYDKPCLQEANDNLYEGCTQDFNSLEEPNDVCINCKGFKDCWLNYNCAEENCVEDPCECDNRDCCGCDGTCCSETCWNDECKDECCDSGKPGPVEEVEGPLKIAAEIYEKINRKREDLKRDCLEKALYAMYPAIVDEKYRPGDDAWESGSTIDWIIFDADDLLKYDDTLPKDFLDIIDIKEFEKEICRVFDFKEAVVIANSEIHCQLV